MYYRLAINYALKSEEIKARDNGFIVERSYVHVDAPEDVKIDGITSQIIVKAGKRVKVTLKLTNKSRRYHVALVDKLPAGLEVLNPALKGTQGLPKDLNEQEQVPLSHYRFIGCGQYWYEHQNFRDQRVEVFSTLLLPGEHKYSYIARGTTAGTFQVPPTHAEEMYSPEIFGRSASNILLVQ